TIKFMGGTKEPEKAYNSADVVVMSSITEGFPFAVIEAMACGKAIIASDVGGVGEALQGCGILVRSRRAHELANAIVMLLNDESRRTKLGIAAAKKVSEEFTLEQSITKFQDQYELFSESSEKIDCSKIGVS
ncbi:MAG: glycosyltransferase family 4 protein, partial [Nitrososphaerales archaeon]